MINFGNRYLYKYIEGQETFEKISVKNQTKKDNYILGIISILVT